MRKKFKLKNSVLQKLKVLGVVFAVVLGIFCIYSYQIHGLTRLGYSKEASRKILFQFKKKYVLSVGENKTLNAAFESSAYKEENLEQYAKIDYQNHEHLISNINTLIKKGYSNSNISMILAHGSDQDVTDFTKRKKIRYLEEFYSVSYAKLKNYDRYVAYADETGEDEETTVLAVNLDMDKDVYQDPTLVDTHSTTMLVNKHRNLAEDYVPESLVSIDKKYASDDEQKAVRVAVDAFISMYKQAKSEGYELIINSSYRSYQEQVDICETYANLYGNSYVNNYVAKPGFSEHQTGLSFDIGSRNSNVFANSKEYTWMQENAYKFGFIQRFPKKYESVTGFRAEPWHYRYVGKKIAKYIHEEKISFEEYYAKFLDK